MDIKFLFKPRFWILGPAYSAEWDSVFVDLMAKHKFKNFDGYTAKLDNVEIWVKNYPFACMMPRKNFNNLFVRPSRANIEKAYAKLIQDVYGH